MILRCVKSNGGFTFYIESDICNAEWLKPLVKVSSMRAFERFVKILHRDINREVNIHGDFRIDIEIDE